jgi:hypothetical protein
VSLGGVGEPLITIWGNKSRGEARRGGGRGKGVVECCSRLGQNTSKGIIRLRQQQCRRQKLQGPGYRVGVQEEQEQQSDEELGQ